MKKILLAITAALAAMTLSAQNLDIFEFVDKNGNAIPNEATLTLTEITAEEDVFTGETTNIMYSGLSLRNKTASAQSMRVNLTIERIDNGNYQLCFPMACKTYAEETNVVTEGGEMAAGEIRDLMTEWFPEAEGGCDVILTVEILNKTGVNAYTYVCDGPTVTLHFRNGITDDVVGDITGDGNVDISDVNAVINMMLGKLEVVEAGDLNEDGQIDISDVNGIINLMLGK
ncbi:MAG: dockerin type I repeat-containing protein [Muribaculaceae bacterium]|nr:dockerin type I repeat-containing protein [Muribaculaceae bacterium]